MPDRGGVVAEMPERDPERERHRVRTRHTGTVAELEDGVAKRGIRAQLRSDAQAASRLQVWVEWRRDLSAQLGSRGRLRTSTTGRQPRREGYGGRACTRLGDGRA
jgi:hypothetical protein